MENDVTEEPDITHDKLIDFAIARNKEDGARSESSGESRAKIKEFLEDTGMNSQALSWSRSILKKRDADKAMDVIRSLEVALPMVKAHVQGQTGPELPLEGDDADPDEVVPFNAAAE